MKLKFSPDGPEVAVTRLALSSQSGADFSSITAFLESESDAGAVSIRVERTQDGTAFLWGGKAFSSMEVVDGAVDEPLEDTQPGVPQVLIARGAVTSVEEAEFRAALAASKEEMVVTPAPAETVSGTVTREDGALIP